MSIEAIKDDLNAAASREEADAVFKSAYIAGYTLRELANIIGVTGESIRRRIARPIDPSLFYDYAPSERVVRKAVERRDSKLARKRIMGLKLSSPALQVPVETLTELARLSELATQVRGWTPLDSPARQAVRPYGDLLHSTIEKYGIPQTHLEKLLGYGRISLTVWLRNHGYLPQMPSQKTYQGVFVDLKNGNPARGRRKGNGKRLELGKVCRSGNHTMTAKTLGRSGERNYCKPCAALRERKRHQARKASALGEDT